MSDPSLKPAKGKRRSPLTTAEEQEFLDKLAELPHVTRAANVGGRARELFYRRRKQDKEFAAAWDLAIDIGLGGLQDKVVDWALNGYTVVERTMKGSTEVGRRERQVIDPALALRILERRHPDWKPKQEVTAKGPTGVLIVPGRMDVEDWEARFPDTGELLNK